MLLLQFQLFNGLLIVVRLIHTQIIQKFSASCDFRKKSSAGRVIFFVLLKMFRDHIDFLREDCDLHLRGAGIFIMRAVLANKSLFCRAFEGHKRLEEAQRNGA